MHATEMPEAPHPIPLPPKSDLSDFDHVWWRSRASPTSTMFGGEVGQVRLRPCLVAKSGKSDFDHVWWRSRASPTSRGEREEIGQTPRSDLDAEVRRLSFLRLLEVAQVGRRLAGLGRHQLAVAAQVVDLVA